MAAVGASALIHVLGVGVIVFGLLRAPMRPTVINAPVALSAWALALAEQGLELEKFELSPEISVVSEAQALPEAWQSRSGDETIRQTETSPRLALGSDPQPPAPDGGEGVGQAQPRAWRRDRQTLRAQLTDGASNYRQARTRQHNAARSPQAERREPRVGAGDAPTTNHRLLALQQAQPLQSEGEEVVVPSDTGALEQAPGHRAQSGAGPLMAEQGARRFDVDQVGAAADLVNQRSASNERNPGPLDLSAAGAMGPAGGQTQTGPANKPGAVARPSQGVAAAEYGAPVPTPLGNQVALNAKEAQRNRYEREIRRRAQAMMKFPRKLALELQQGETIVRFVVAADGSVQGPVAVSKSAGFAEFDAEAVGAVRRAAPFPRMPEPLTVVMRVAFENPVLR